MLCHIASHCCGESGLISIQPPDLSGSLQRDLDGNHHEKLGERLHRTQDIAYASRSNKALSYTERSLSTKFGLYPSCSFG